MLNVIISGLFLTAVLIFYALHARDRLRSKRLGSEQVEPDTERVQRDVPALVKALLGESETVTRSSDPVARRLALFALAFFAGAAALFVFGYCIGRVKVAPEIETFVKSLF